MKIQYAFLLKYIETPAEIQRVFVAESKGFEPSNRFRRLHDFQSCSFDQLGQLSVWHD